MGLPNIKALSAVKTNAAATCVIRAFVDAVEPKSNAKISGRTSDISLGGCYVDTINPFPAETIIKIRLTNERETFEADAKVVLSKVGMGMGVAFISAVPQQVRIF